MLHKSKSTPSLVCNSKNRMIKSNSNSGISAMLSDDNKVWSIPDVEHVSPFIPVSNISKCMVTHTFPLSLIDDDKTAIDMSLCLVEPGYAEKNEKGINFENIIEEFKNKTNRNRKRNSRNEEY